MTIPMRANRHHTSISNFKILIELFLLLFYLELTNPFKDYRLNRLTSVQDEF